MDDYLDAVRQALLPALCLHALPSPQVERHERPEVETRENPALLLPSVEIASARARDAGAAAACSGERCMIEQSINSTRISFSFKSTDATEAHLAATYLRFMMHRAEQLDIVRRVPVPGYDISFLITSGHLERYSRERLVDFLCQFVSDFHAELKEMRLGLATRSRALADRFWQVAAAAAAEQQGQQRQAEAVDAS